MKNLGEHPTLLELSTQGSLMDSCHFMWFCFLILTAVASHPTVAMPCENPAEGRQDSSFGKTKVTVYYCKTCERHICQESNYEGFEIIAETQNKTFSNNMIELETNETHIIMCFQQENAFPEEGIYGIFWERAFGVGDSCGILNSGASPENVTGNIKICCGAEIDLSMPKQHLKCNTKISDEKDRKSTCDITEEGDPGNPQFSVSNQSSIGIITLITLMLFVGVCAAALTLVCVRQNPTRTCHNVPSDF